MCDTVHCVPRALCAAASCRPSLVLPRLSLRCRPSTHLCPSFSSPPWHAAAGVDSGFQLRLEGVMPGGPQGMPPGDLIVQIEVMPSPVFRREDFDLFVDVPVSMVDACLGTSIE